MQKYPDQTGIYFTNHAIENDSLNILTYPYIFNGAGVATGDINNDGWDDIFFVSNKRGGNKLYLNKTGFKFEDISETAGIQGYSDFCTGVAMVDINADGWLDIYISTVSIPGKLNSRNELYINNKNGTFTESASGYGLDFNGHTTQAAFFDYDNDGDLDCFLLNHAIGYAEDYKDISSRKRFDSLSGDKLYENKNGKFTDVTVKAGILSSSLSYGLGIAIGDLNNDGWPDIYVSNDFKENDYCYLNNKNGTFTERSNDLFAHNSRFSMGNDMADYNNDGWLDIMTLDMLSPDEKILKSSVADDHIVTFNYKHNFGFNYQFSKNCLQQNVDGKFFQDVSLQKGIAATDWSWAPLFADFDNDGRKDLYISNGFKYRVNNLDFNVFLQGTLVKDQQQNIKTDKLSLLKKMPEGKAHDYLYIQEKSGNFLDASSSAGFTRATLSNGAAYADLDKDGKLDIVVNHLQGPAGIYKNNMPDNNYINIHLKGNGSNTLGIGTSVYLYTNGVCQLYTQFLSRGFMSSVSPIIHAGIGHAKIIDSIIIKWPNGMEQKLYNILPGNTLEIAEANSNKINTTTFFKPYINEYWKNITQSTGISFTHKEDDFEDLNAQPLLPHSLASQGPAIAVADVNNDGLEDFFVCGARGQAGQLWIQTGQSTFKLSVQGCFAGDSMYEETNALFFDANGDKIPDLYVVSGGNEFFGFNKLLNDRLYLNDGKGNFTASNGLPALFENKSCVAACDFDKDGDIDLFVGGRVNARRYGYNPASVLLINDGKGNFTESTEKVSTGLQHIGMVTSACWSDIDGDGWQDLIVAGEWMPICIFKNKKGRLEREDQSSLQKSNGWWNCLFKADLDGDGDEDFLLGNWGTNSKLHASAAHPLMMYLADWDNNRNMDPILCLYKKGDYYTFLGKADLEKSLPYLKKKYLMYSDIAGKSAEALLGKDAVAQAKKLSAYTLHSSILWNDNGKLNLQPLPDYLQVSPVFSFASYINDNGGKYYVAGGNFFDVSPYEGRYDAMLPVIFSVQKNKKVDENGYLFEKGAVRDIKTIKIKNHAALLLAKNNERLEVLFKK